MASGTAAMAEQQGDALAAARPARTSLLEGTYTLPYLAHACMEPLNCTGVGHAGPVRDLGADPGARAWCGHRAGSSPAWPPTRSWCIRMLHGRRARTQVRAGLHRRRRSGSRKAVGAAGEAHLDARAGLRRTTSTGPWRWRGSRVGLDAAGNVAGLAQPHRLALDPGPARLDRGRTATIRRRSTARSTCPYALGARLVEYVRHPAGMPVGFWRSVGHSINAFVGRERDRRDRAGRRRRSARVPAQPARRGCAPRWRCSTRPRRWAAGAAPPPAGRARGIACRWRFGSIVAQVAEVLDAGGRPDPRAPGVLRDRLRQCHQSGHR